MGFESRKADPDVWLKPGMKDNETECWEHVLLCTDDVLAIMMDPEKFVREEMDECFELKKHSVASLNQCLGNKVLLVELASGVKCWSFSSSQFIQNSVKSIEECLHKKGEKSPLRAKSPCSSGYLPESDASPELSPREATCFQCLI